MTLTGLEIVFVLEVSLLVLFFAYKCLCFDIHDLSTIHQPKISCFIILPLTRQTSDVSLPTLGNFLPNVIFIPT